MLVKNCFGYNIKVYDKEIKSQLEELKNSTASHINWNLFEDGDYYYDNNGERYIAYHIDNNTVELILD